MLPQPPFGHATALLKIIHWLSVAYKINFILLCLRFQGSVRWIHRVYCIYCLEFMSVFFLSILSLLEMSSFLLFPSLNTQDSIQINFHMIFLSISAHDLSLFLWILFVLVCAHYVDIYSHTADINICFMSAGYILPMEW